MDDNLIKKFREEIKDYYPISEISFEKLLSITSVSKLRKNEIYLQKGFLNHKISFLYSGYMVTYIYDENGNKYNKNIFIANDWVGSLGASIMKKPSEYAIKALTDCILIDLPYKKFRELMYETEDLKLFYIHYLEKKWVVEKEQKEVSIVMENAASRYNKFLERNKKIENYLTLQEIASYLGITPTQLSRIRKQIK